MTETVAVPEDTTAYKLSGSLPVVGTETTALAAIGKPVVVVTPASPMNAAALEDTNTPSVSGALPIVATRVAVVPTLVWALLYPDIYFVPFGGGTFSTHPFLIQFAAVDIGNSNV
jgi:hypothetical protein